MTAGAGTEVRPAGSSGAVPRRVVFFAEAVTLAHVARPVRLASALDPAVHQVMLACSARYATLLGTLPFPRHDLRSIEPEQFLATLAAGRAVYDEATLRRYVEEDLQLIDTLKPDVVVGDFRLSLAVSARLRQLPYVNITNAYWSPYCALRIPAPDVPPLRWLPALLAQSVFDAVRPFAFAAHARPLRRVFRYYGLPPPPADVRWVYTSADHVAYADVPELVPMRELPAHHRFIGPVLWAPAIPPPPWWSSLEDGRTSMIYVTLGSSGLAAVLPRVLSALADLPVLCLAATAGRPCPGPVPANARLADFLPGDAAAARAALVVCNGGSPTCYQALHAGVPVLGICTNLDQQLNMAALVRAGAGLSLPASSANIAVIRRAVEVLLGVPGFREAAGRVRAAIGACDATQRFADLLGAVR